MADSITRYLNALWREQGLDPAGYGNPSARADTAFKRQSYYEKHRESSVPDILDPKEYPSTCVQSLEYEQDSEIMVIHFQQRGSYKYFQVPAWAFNEFNNAGSRGTYFNLYLRNAGYPYQRIG